MKWVNSHSIRRKQQRLAFLFGCLLMVAGGSTAAQSSNLLLNRQIQHYGVEDGLSQGSVYGILKDSRGFMWFTSYEGLNRFDGHQFKVYYSQPDDSTSLEGSLTLGLVEDPYGDIWVGSEQVLNRYSRQKDHFTHIFAEDGKGVPQSAVHFPFYADSNEVWYINELEGLMAYDYHQGTKRLISADFRYQWNSSIINSTLYDQEAIWIRQAEGLVRIDPQDGTQQHYFSSAPQNQFGRPTAFICHFAAGDGSLWLGLKGGVGQFIPQSHRWQYYPIDPAIVVADIRQNTDGLLYLGTEDHGLFLLDPEQGIVGHLTSENSRLKNLSAVSLYVDNQELLWINTDPEGIDVLFPPGSGLGCLGTDFFEKHGFVSAGIRCFAEAPDNSIWVGSEEDGIFQLNAQTNQIQRHLRRISSNGLTENHASALLIDQRNQLWVGTYNGIFRSEDGTSFQAIPTASASTAPPTVWDILATEADHIWVASSQGLMYTSPYGESLQTIDTLRSLTTGDIEHWQNWLLIPEYHRGFWIFDYQAWLASDGQEEIAYHPFQQFNVKHFAPQGDSLLWLATTTGLVKLKPRADFLSFDILAHYTKADGLPSEYLYGILWDEDGQMWMSSNRGIIQSDPQNEQFRAFGPDKQVQGYEFNTNAYLKSSRGELYFGGTQGLNRIQPPLARNEKAPQVQFIALKVNGDLQKTIPYIGELDALTLPYTDNTFTLYFSAIDYLSGGANQYRVRLLGYEEDWSNLGDQAEIRYTRVPPGHYAFEVIAANNDGRWQTTPGTLRIQILSPWYLKPLALVFYTGLALGFLVLLRRLYLRRKRLRAQLAFEHREAQRLKELDEFKSQVFTHITHEFRTPLTVINGLAEEVREQAPQRFQDNLSRIRKNGASLLQLVNQMLEMARLQTGHWPEHREEHDLHTFLQLQVDARQASARRAGVQLKLQTRGPSCHLLFDAPKWERILANLLDNAIQYTPAEGSVSLQLSAPADGPLTGIWLNVKDTGAGMSPATQARIFEPFFLGASSNGSGIGLALVKELVTVLNGTIEVESHLGKGSVFKLFLPAEAVPVQQVKQQRSNPPTGNGQPLIMIVEDNVDVNHYLHQVLTKEWTVLSARNGQQAWDLIQNHIPDVVLSDIMMPEMDGLELCRRIKNDQRTSHIPVLLFTARASREDQLKGFEHGADAYLPKPVDQHELRQRIHNFLLARQKMQDYWQQGLSSQASSTKLPPVERSFLDEVNRILEQQLSDADLQTTFLCRQLGMSRTQLHRKLKAITGLSTSRYIRYYRLDRAHELLRSTDLTISEIAYQTGFSNLSWFSQAYRERYGNSPSSARK